MTNSNQGAARFTKRFDESQRQAILKAVLADGHTVAEARRMARAGQLGVPAFEIGTYAYRLVDDGRERFEAENPEALDRATRDELKRLHRMALAKSRALAETSDVAEIARTAKALAETERALTTGHKTKPATRTKANANTQDNAPTDPSQAESANVVATLLEAAQRGAGSGSLTRAPKPEPESHAA